MSIVSGMLQDAAMNTKYVLLVDYISSVVRSFCFCCSASTLNGILHSLNGLGLFILTVLFISLVQFVPEFEFFGCSGCTFVHEHLWRYFMSSICSHSCFRTLECFPWRYWSNFHGFIRTNTSRRCLLRDWLIIRYLFSRQTFHVEDFQAISSLSVLSKNLIVEPVVVCLLVAIIIVVLFISIFCLLKTWFY